MDRLFRLTKLAYREGGTDMRKKFIQALVGLVIVSGLVLGPIAPGAASRKGGRAFAPPRALAMRTILGWDWGGSGGS
jgi:hypothetical protein